MHGTVDAKLVEEWRQAFLVVLPRIVTQAKVYFRHWRRNPQRFEEAIEDTCGVAWKFYLRERLKGKSPDEYISRITDFAAKRVGTGRTVEGQEKANDVLSQRAQRSKGFSVQSLAQNATDREENEAVDALADNRLASPADQAAFRSDTPRWLDQLDPAKRPAIDDMLMSYTTSEIAKRRNKTAARISQIRAEAHDDYLRFHDELEPNGKGL